MGLANLIPGVSGGTMAVITGVYEDLVKAISSIFKLQKKDGIILLWIGIGIVVSIFGGAKLFDLTLKMYPFYMYAFFFGLILASFFYLFKNAESFKLVPFILGVVLVIFPHFLPQRSVGDGFIYFLGGVVGGSAMIVPGLSGSLMLLVIGIYESVINAVSDFQVFILFQVGAGVILGVFFTTLVLKWAFSHYRAVVESFILGLVFASLYLIFPPSHGKGNLAVGILVLFIGVLSFFLIERMGKKS
ncbi:DUF368 domain-containing protein [Thermosipho ferrireducens]|uniref:DUF368 domain-containing protein n=2 Tax=Thermosipho ferrireducens TaxID=2571116 RepID=A0ABX7S8P4_9BACT|nr:DUF368 domain-containing protein [Thermosipho ferrireducens]